MITIETKVFEHGPEGLQLHVRARGQARSQREQIYYEELRRAIEGAIVTAGAKVAEHGLAAPLEAETIAALKASAPTLEAETSVSDHAMDALAVAAKGGGLVDTGIQIDLPDGPKQLLVEPFKLRPPPPRFSEFSETLLQELAGVETAEREANLCEQSVALAGKMRAVVASRCAAFADQAARFAAWAAEQRQALQRN